MNVFVFDERKGQANLEKHGIDCVSAQDLWQDPDIVEVQVRTEDEPRFLRHCQKTLVSRNNISWQHHQNNICQALP